MTGFGQDGPLASAAGHDINYIALGGALEMIGPAGQAPVFPVNLLGDFAGGGMMLVFGIVCAAYERERSGLGQVIDAAMIDGVAAILGPMFMAKTTGFWGPRGTNHLDGGAPFYNVYETADRKWISIGAIEPQFHAELYRRLGLAEPDGWETDGWAAEKDRLAEVFRARTRDEWCELLEGTDSCFAPVLSVPEMLTHPHTANAGDRCRHPRHHPGRARATAVTNPGHRQRPVPPRSALDHRRVGRLDQLKGPLWLIHSTSTRSTRPRCRWPTWGPATGTSTTATSSM
ncbi:MAG: CoA transferase [Ilumatobacteraceae bacterium]